MIKKGILLIMVLILSCSAFGAGTLFIGPAPIELDDIKLYINGDSADCDVDNNDDCDDEFEEIRLGSILELEITLDNIGDDDIEDIKVIIDSSNNDVDIDDRSVKHDIDEGDEETYDFDFELDDDIEHGDDSTIDITVTYFYNNVTYNITYDFDIEFETPEYEIQVFTSIAPNWKESENPKLCYEIINTGRKDQDHIKVVVNDKVLEEFKIQDGKEINSCSYLNTSNVGNNIAKVKVYYNSDRNDYDYIFLEESYNINKEVIEEPKNETTENILIVEKEPETQGAMVIATYEEKSLLDSETFLNTIAVILGIIMLTLFVILVNTKNGKKNK